MYTYTHTHTLTHDHSHKGTHTPRRGLSWRSCLCEAEGGGRKSPSHLRSFCPVWVMPAVGQLFSFLREQTSVKSINCCVLRSTVQIAGLHWRESLKTVCLCPQEHLGSSGVLQTLNEPVMHQVKVRIQSELEKASRGGRGVGLKSNLTRKDHHQHLDWRSGKRSVSPRCAFSLFRHLGAR